MYKIIGKVVGGDGYGRKLGFPTVNLEALPPSGMEEGVYAGTAILDNKEYRAGIVVGPGERVEAHLIEYNGDAYGKQVYLKLEKFLRKYKKFGTEEELVMQIRKDLQSCSSL